MNDFLNAEIRCHALLPGGALVCCFLQSLDSVVQLLYPLPLIRVRLPTFLMFGLELVQHCAERGLLNVDTTDRYCQAQGDVASQEPGPGRE